MKVEIRIPKMGESIVEATIGAILKPSGSFVKEGEQILEIETAKVNQVLSAPISGKIELTVRTGDPVKIDQLIGSIEAEKEPFVQPAPLASKPPSERPSIPEAGARKSMDSFLEELSAPVKAPTPTPLPIREEGKERRKKMSKLRQVIASRLVQVKNETAMLTTFNEIDMSAVIQLREENQEQFQKKHGVKLGFMSFFIKACVSALQQFPDLNARIEKEEIVYSDSCDISVAVSTDKGLFVPVIRRAEELSYAEIERKLKELAEKARSGTISVDEMQGGTFTITNGGIYGSMLSTPILNPPQSGILGMHNIVKRPVVVDDQIVIRPIMYVALSYDHRIVDGKESISFLLHLKNHLEKPARVLLDL